MASVNVICVDNGVGLSKDLRIILGLLNKAGYDTHHLGDPNSSAATYQGRKFDLNIHVEIVASRHYRQARTNVIIPNQEWYMWPNAYRRFRYAFCKSHHAVDIFSKLNFNTIYTSFTSVDRSLDVPYSDKEKEFLHLAGKSRFKNTLPILRAWNEHPSWPVLHLYNAFEDLSHLVEGDNIDYYYGYVPSQQFKQLQNKYAYFILPSASEGFGHLLWEQLSTSSILITTNAPPMNEMMSDFFLVDYYTKDPHHQGHLHRVSEEAVAEAVNNLLYTSEEELERLSLLARKTYEKNDTFFRRKFLEAVERCI